MGRDNGLSNKKKEEEEEGATKEKGKGVKNKFDPFPGLNPAIGTKKDAFRINLLPGYDISRISCGVSYS